MNKSKNTDIILAIILLMLLPQIILVIFFNYEKIQRPNSERDYRTCESSTACCLTPTYPIPGIGDN